MLSLITSLALMAAAQPAPPPTSATISPPQLPMVQQTTLRCSVAIAMAADQQRAGQAQDKGWPDLTVRGREFFVRSLARLMDEAALTREEVGLRVEAELGELRRPGVHEAVMPGCLLLLDASGL